MSAEDGCEAFNPDRSVGRYTQFIDLYGTNVKVAHSSLAEQDAVWVFTDDGAAHLCTAMAREVRNALSWFLDEAEPCGNDPDGH